MYPFYNNIVGFPPFPLLGPVPVTRRRSCLKQIKIFELPTNGVALSASSVDYGINPRIYNQLPCECYITLRIRQAVPAGGENLPVNVVVPTNSSSSTVSTPGATTGTKKAPVIDHDNSQVTGTDVSEFTDALALLDKSLGIIKFVNFRSASTSSNAQVGNTPAEASVSKSK